MGFEVDESNWPIVVARWRGTVTDGELAGVLARIDGFLARGERFGMLVDSRGGGGFSPEQRALVIRHMRANAQRTATLMVQAAVIDNLLQRTLFYAVNLVFPNPFPSKTFAELEPARAWLVTKLELPPRAR